MEVVKPELIWIENRCYRKNPCHSYTYQDSSQSHSKYSQKSKENPYTEFDLHSTLGCDPNGIEDEDDHNCTSVTNSESYVIEEIEGQSGFKTVCTDIPSALFSSIIGTKAAIKKRIESETRTFIIVPKINENGFIVVKGQKKLDVIRARQRIDTISCEARFKRDATHFIGFPINSHTIIRNVREFMMKVLDDFKDPRLGIDEKIFQEPEKIHLTICVLMLLDQNERKAAENILESLKAETDFKNIVTSGNFRIRLQGIEIMNDDPSNVNVLYAKCQTQDNSLQKLADILAQKFYQSGFSKKGKGDNVKLHATLMNTRFKTQDTSTQSTDDFYGYKRPGSISSTFNAQPILNKYGEYDFGFVEVSEIHLSTRFTKGTDGFYKAFARLSLK